MHTLLPIRHLPKLFLTLAAAYLLASLGHFSHNAEFICEYPNLPAWLTRAKVYGTWAAITSVGAVGFLLIGWRFIATGLAFVAAWAAMGFDGLGHYALAPMAFHTLTANITILAEVAVAAALLPVALYLFARQLHRQATHRRAACR